MPAPALAFGFNTPFQEQIDFLVQKLRLPSERWDDIMRSAHDRAFIVAGAAKADLLADLHESLVQAAIDAGGLVMTEAEMDAIRNAPVVPQSVTRRQAKTVMELTPNPTHGNLWQAALAAAGAIPEAQTRIVTTNYLMESLNFEYPQVLSMAQSLLGMTSTQVDALFIAAAQL